VVVVVFGLVAVLFLLVVRRRRRKIMLAGLNGARPVFSVEPPHRRHSQLDREAL
jgi:hypothetical protein